MADTGERTRAWDEAKAKEMAEIARLAADTREKAEAEDKARLRIKPTLFRGQRRRLSPR